MFRVPIHVPNVGAGEVSFKGKRSAHIASLLTNQVQFLGFKAHMSVFMSSDVPVPVAEEILFMDTAQQQFLTVTALLMMNGQQVSLN